MNPEAKPFPPGDYPAVIVGSGPGGLQVSYFLRSRGIDHALISSDDAPGGMFRQLPLFQRLITWTKPHAPVGRAERFYEWYDWNSLTAKEIDLRGFVAKFLDGTSYFPARSEMENGISAFVEGAGIKVRYGCSWESTRREGDDRFTLVTSDGEYRCRVAVFAVGMTQPWRPMVPGIEEVPHYVEMRREQSYAGRRVFLIGKRNSGFEIADALLPHASQIILGSPSPARISVREHTTAAARARYLQPYEDHILGGGNIVLDAAIERIERRGAGWRVYTKGTTKPGDLVFDVDDVIAATGFTTPLRDLPELGVATFYGGGRLPAQTPFWESPSVPGIYFAGSITQGAIGLKKYGIPSNSAAVHGFRYNAMVMTEHIATTKFDMKPIRRAMKREEIAPFLLSEATRAPELWNQQSYLARIVTIDRDAEIFDEGIHPLAHFLDSSGPPAAGLAIETDAANGDIHPVIYIRSGDRTEEHLLPSNPLHSFESIEYQEQVASIINRLE